MVQQELLLNGNDQLLPRSLGLFCKNVLQKQGSFVSKSQKFKEPTDSCYPILHVSVMHNCTYRILWISKSPPSSILILSYQPLSIVYCNKAWCTIAPTGVSELHWTSIIPVLYFTEGFLISESQTSRSTPKHMNPVKFWPLTNHVHFGHDSRAKTHHFSIHCSLTCQSQTVTLTCVML